MRYCRLYCLVAVLATAFFLCITMGHAQTLPFTNYTTMNGLSGNLTHVIRQDQKGYIWIGTGQGINRYDGRNFKLFPCPAKGYHPARDAKRYGDSVIFIVDYFGIAVCYGDSVRFLKLGVDPVSSIYGCIPGNDTGSFYVLNIATGICRMTEKKTEKILLPKPFKNEENFLFLFRDSRSNIWVSSAEGLIYFQGGNLHHPVQVPFFGKQKMSIIDEDKKTGDIYISAGQGLFYYTAAQRDSILTARPTQLPPVVKDVYGVAFDAYDNVWIGSGVTGVFMYNKRTKALKNYTVANGLACNNVYDIFCDKENNIWAATDNGVSKLATQAYSSYDFTNSSYGNVISACALDDSTLLFSNMLDVFTYRNGRIAKVSGFKNIIGFFDDILLKTPDNKIFVNVNTRTQGSTFHVSTYTYELKNDKFIKRKRTLDLKGGVDRVNIIHGFARISDEMMMVSTSDGLKIYTDGQFKTAPSFKVNNKNLRATCIAQNTNGDIWFIHDKKELVCYQRKADNETGSFLYEQKQFFTANNLGDQQFRKLFFDKKGNVWLCGSELGMVYLKTNADGIVTHVDTLIAKRFSSCAINDIIEDDDRNLWVGTVSGLDKVVFSKDSFEIERDKYSSELCSKYIHFLEKVGDELYIGTSGCLGVIKLSKYEQERAPEVLISGIKINEKDALGLLGSKAELNPTENFISFAFTGIYYKDERRIRYSYMLEGLDDKWSTPGTEYSITYSSIPPGEYTFKVRSMSANGVWSLKPATFSFTIRQPFYTRWWFIAIVACIISTIIYSIYRNRINRLLEIQHIRQTISKDLHDDIGATVSSINILANMAKSDLVSENKRNQFLETIQEESKFVSESLNDIVWSINPKNDAIEVIFAKMQRYASELFEARNITYSITLPDMLPAELTLDMATRQHVYLIFKEAVNNLAKYSMATKADIRLSVNKTEFSIYIADNGQGFDVNAAYTGNGIFNMKKRARDIGAHLEIDSAPEKGTNILLKIHI